MTHKRVRQSEFTIAALNTWEANVPEYLDWAVDELSKYDVALLSEVHSYHQDQTEQALVPVPNQFEILQQRLSGSHVGHFARSAHTREGVAYGLAIFHKYPLRMFGIQSDVIHGAYDAPWKRPRVISSCSQIQSGVIDCGSSWLLCAHIHGLWKESGKHDCPERAEQNQRIRAHLQRRTSDLATPDKPVVVLLCGDFNYTSSMQALDELACAPEFGSEGAFVLNTMIPAGFNTRTCEYKKAGKEADYMLLSRAQARVLDFNVNNRAPSDHALLSATIQLP